MDEDGDVHRDKGEDGDRDEAGNAVVAPPPSLQVAKAGEGFVGTARDFGDGAVGGQVRGSPLNLPPSGLVIPGTVFPPGDLLAPVALLSGQPSPHRIEVPSVGEWGGGGVGA